MLNAFANAEFVQLVHCGRVAHVDNLPAGAEVHGANGYLIEQLLNPLVNLRAAFNGRFNAPDEATFYVPGPKGYTDCPALAA